MTLRPGDAIALGGETWRVAETRFERMTVQVDLVRADSPGAGAGSAVEAGRNVAQLDAVHGPTTLVVVDLPALSDTAVAGPMLGVFAAGISPGWRRAALMASTDGGATFTPVGTTALPAAIGATTTALAKGSPHVVDRINSVEVELLNAAMVLGDADTAALLAGANRMMVGEEMLQFGRAEPMSPTRWRLAELWRARRGTEDVPTAHPAGTRVVMLEDAAMAAVPPANGVAGVRIMAAGIGDRDPYPQATCATAIRAVTPLSPVHPVVRTLPTGDVSIAWTRRSRSGWAWHDGVDAPIGEGREAYRVTWSGGDVELATAAFTYTTAQRAADAAGGATGVTFAIRQLGDAAVSASLLVVIDPI